MIDIQSVFSGERGLRLRVAKTLKITHGAVSQWRRVPVERVLDVEKITGIPRHVLRPDIYPPSDRETGAA
jgi:DNA-binding transcriptional regulator YdaS (Cro superfamily)